MAKYVLSAADAVARAAQTDRGLYAPLRPVLIGPKAGLHRYAVAAERASLGAYDAVTDTTYAYPHKASGSVVDTDYVKLYADAADLQYLSKAVGDGHGTADVDADYPNRVRLSNYVLKTANDVDRSSVFGDRDVKVGDVVKLSKVVSSVLYELETTVTGLVADQSAAATGSATSDSNNATTASATATVEQVDDTPVNDVVATASAAAYESTADGYVNRTYTITVTQGSTGGDATTARLSVVSSDGLDDQASVTPAAFSSPTAIGTKGATVTFAIDPAHSTSPVGISETDFVVGQQWTLAVTQAFTAPVPTSGGTYTGTVDDTYIVTVTRGGPYSGTDKPLITVTTANGSDASGPTEVTATATFVTIGSHGVQIKFSQTKLRKGDKYYVTATAPADTEVRTLVLRDDAPSQLQGEDVNLTLAARKSGVLVPKNRTVDDVVSANWSCTAAHVVVEAGIQLFDAEFTADGTQFAVDLAAATLYAEYREWLADDAASVVTVSALDAVEAALGTVDPDNPIAYAARCALANTLGGLSDTSSTDTDLVLCVPLGGAPDDTALWADALGAVADDDRAYGIVPLSTLAAVRTLVAEHVASQSADSAGFFRVAWLAADADATAARVSAATSTDHAVVTATISADPDVSPTQYTRVTAGSDANFVTNGVAAGDELRIDFGTAADGTETYTSYTVAEVLSETSLNLESGPAGAVSPARRIEVWHTLTKAEQTAAQIAKAAAFASERVRYVWPDTAGFGGTTLAGYHVCAALAGLAGSVPSHQGLRNVGLEGFDDLTRTSRFFTSAQIEQMRLAGVFVVTQTPEGVVYTAAASTTDPSTVATREEMAVRNGDMLRKAVQQKWAPYVGAGNVTSNLGDLLRGALASLTGKLKASAHVQELGPAVGDLKLAGVSTVPGQSDAVAVTVTVIGAAVPLNKIVLTLPISF